MAANQGQHNAPLHVLVAAVTAAERGEPMPTHAQLAEDIGCVPHNVTMALAGLERRGVLQRVPAPGGRKRVLIARTGAMTAEAGE